MALEMYTTKYLEVILVIGAANKFSHLYVRNGKIISALSISANFVVDNGK